MTAVKHVEMPPSPRCPVCRAPCKLYTRTTVRGRKTKGGKHRPGEQRNRREWRATCGKARCRAVLRARTMLERHDG